MTPTLTPRTNPMPRDAHVPLRRCVVCKQSFPKQALRRHVLGSTDAGPGLLHDVARRLPGRGYYCCEDARCLTKFASYQGWRKRRTGGAA